jgi:hypothetical protein
VPHPAAAAQQKETPMAFSLRNLSVLAYANGFTLWHYKMQAGGPGDVAASGFFDEAGDMLASGDMMMVSSRSGGAMLCVLADKSGIRTAPMC